MSNYTRVGKINYANVWPVFFDFPGTELASHIKVFEMTPAQLNEALLHDQVDMGFISSYAYLQHKKDYEILPNISISAFGKVSSILFFHNSPIRDICSGKIALTNTSATSVHLLKIMLELYYGGSPNYLTTPPNLQVMLDDLQADGALLIGDDAIKASFNPPTRYVTDLGEWWLEATGHSMTYAVWAIKKSYAEQNRQRICEIEKQLEASLRVGLQQKNVLIQRAVSEIGGSPLFWHNYYEQLRFTFGSEEQQGLLAYDEALLKWSTPAR